MTECTSNVKLVAIIDRINTSMASWHCRPADHNFKFPVELCTSLPGSCMGSVVLCWSPLTSHVLGAYFQ